MYTHNLSTLATHDNSLCFWVEPCYSFFHPSLWIFYFHTVLAKGPPPDEEEPKPSEDPVVIDNQEEDSCYHSNDDLDESAPKDAVVVVGNGGGNEVEVEIKNPVEENPGWDADHLEVSAC